MSSWTVAWAVGGFFIGSVPPAVVVGRLWGVRVLREGTRNPGVSNVSELAGTTAAVLTFAADLAIGVLGALLPQWVGATMWDAALVCVFLVVGRVWSPWMRGWGGRGQMLVLATVVALVPYAGAVFVGIFAIGAAARQVALANVFALGSLLVFPWVFYRTGWALTYGVTVGIIGIIRRLMGTPDGRPHSIWQRLLYDRERVPEPSTATEPT